MTSDRRRCDIMTSCARWDCGYLIVAHDRGRAQRFSARCIIPCASGSVLFYSISSLLDYWHRDPLDQSHLALGEKSTIATMGNSGDFSKTVQTMGSCLKLWEQCKGSYPHHSHSYLPTSFWPGGLWLQMTGAQNH